MERESPAPRLHERTRLRLLLTIVFSDETQGSSKAPGQANANGGKRGPQVVIWGAGMPLFQLDNNHSSLFPKLRKGHTRLVVSLVPCFSLRQDQDWPIWGICSQAMGEQ